jgi:phage FluMu protein Com
MIREELELHKYVGNFLKERLPQADNTIQQTRCTACNVLYHVEGSVTGLCPFCREELDFYLALPQYHYVSRYKKRSTNTCSVPR